MFSSHFQLILLSVKILWRNTSMFCEAISFKKIRKLVSLVCFSSIVAVRNLTGTVMQMTSSYASSLSSYSCFILLSLSCSFLSLVLCLCPKYFDFQLIIKMLNEKNTDQTYAKVETVQHDLALRGKPFRFPVSLLQTGLLRGENALFTCWYAYLFVTPALDCKPFEGREVSYLFDYISIW